MAAVMDGEQSGEIGAAVTLTFGYGRINIVMRTTKLSLPNSNCETRSQ